MLNVSMQGSFRSMENWSGKWSCSAWNCWCCAVMSSWALVPHGATHFASGSTSICLTWGTSLASMPRFQRYVSIRCRVIFRSRNRQTSREPKPLQINLLLTLLPGELLLLAFESKVRVALGLRSPEYNQIFGGITWYNSISYNSLTYILYILTTSLGRKLTFQNAVHPFHAPTSAWEL